MSTTHDAVELLRRPVHRRGRLVGVAFVGRCTRCGAMSAEVSTAGMVSGWSARHRGLDRMTHPSEVCPALAVERAS